MPAKGVSDVVGQLHVITDAAPGRDPLAAIEAALEGGADTIQVRAKGWTDRDLYHLAATVASRCLAFGAACVIDDRVDIAIAVGAAGVHVGDADLPVEAVRRVAGTSLLVGATARDPEAARSAVAAGASYLGVGPCFETTTKQGLPPAIGLEGIADVAVAVEVPVVAIGGIEAKDVPALIAAGAHGVAVVGAVSRTADPKTAAAELAGALRLARQRR
ncbi:MAG: thiamine phosphate synthase [Actinomycetota bacterium]|nr:thiamine phosphate synthase [Actinomycetota bacterium]